MVGKKKGSADLPAAPSHHHPHTQQRRRGQAPNPRGRSSRSQKSVEVRKRSRYAVVLSSVDAGTLDDPFRCWCEDGSRPSPQEKKMCQKKGAREKTRPTRASKPQTSTQLCFTSPPPQTSRPVILFSFGPPLPKLPTLCLPIALQTPPCAKCSCFEVLVAG